MKLGDIELRRDLNIPDAFDMTVTIKNVKVRFIFVRPKFDPRSFVLSSDPRDIMRRKDQPLLFTKTVEPDFRSSTPFIALLLHRKQLRDHDVCLAFLFFLPVAAHYSLFSVFLSSFCLPPLFLALLPPLADPRKFTERQGASDPLQERRRPFVSSNRLSLTLSSIFILSPSLHSGFYACAHGGYGVKRTEAAGVSDLCEQVSRIAHKAGLIESADLGGGSLKAFRKWGAEDVRFHPKLLTSDQPRLIRCSLVTV